MGSLAEAGAAWLGLSVPRFLVARARPDEEVVLDLCCAGAEAARAARDKEISRLTASLDRQIATLQDRLAREERELTRDQVEYEQRKREETGSLLEMGASVLGLGRKRKEA